MADQPDPLPVLSRRIPPCWMFVFAAMLPITLPAGATPGAGLCSRFEMPPAAIPDALRGAIRISPRAEPPAPPSRPPPRSVPQTRQAAMPAEDPALGCFARPSAPWWQDPPGEPSGLIGMTRFERVAPLGTTLTALASIPGISLGDRPFSTFPPAPPPRTSAPAPIPPAAEVATLLLVDPGPVSVIVPEPEALALLLAGITGLAVAGRRQAVRVRRRR